MSRIAQAENGRSLPDLLMEDFEAGCKGTADVDMMEVLHAILSDVVDTMRLVLDDLPVMGTASEEAERKRQAVLAVEDYIANNYGES